MQALDPRQATKDAETITENPVRARLAQSFGGKKSQARVQDEVQHCVFLITMYFVVYVMN